MHRSNVLVCAALVFTLACSGKPLIDVHGSSAAAGDGGVDQGGSAGSGTANVPNVNLGGDDNGGASNGGEAGEAPITDARCGNSELDDGEGCDDGNTTPGDGCDGLCRLEFGYECPTPGEPCENILVCGDGEPGPNEACDDGNTDSGDGCSKDCKVEAGYTCPVLGEPCEPTTAQPECGNSSVDAGESCDDGNTDSGDGCSEDCQSEDGWICGQPGEPCVRNEYCGDGILNGTEQCDDGNTHAGDCCDGNCKLESNCICRTPSPALDPPHQVCTSTVVCGDGQVTGPEACDDGNTDSGDGCSEDCNNVEPGYSCPPTGGACSEAVELCGNAQIDTNEECDDGQNPMTSGDGCSSDCKVEPGYVCPTAGAPCEPIAFCGDGLVSFPRGETCDDGGNPPESGDGCSDTCKVEQYWRCTGEPSTCTYLVECGNGRIDPTESCDDGNAVSGDGCDSSCQLEEGFTCAAPGIACHAICGDGLLRGREQCDDGDTDSGDGCSSTCVLESAGPGEGDGWVCPTPGQSCQRTDCGNGVPEGSEQCDDGNSNMGDGCTPFCRKEPSCPAAGGACATACGDGLLLDIDKQNGQECDDGNTVNGDGCSSDCKIEAGYECNDVVETPEELVLPIVLRDFDGDYTHSSPPYHPDFELLHGVENYQPEQGIVQPLLGADGKPIHVKANKAMTSNTYDANGNLTSEDYFAEWYRDDSRYNITFLQTLTLARNATDGTYAFDDTSFYPLNDLGWGNYYQDRNYHFTSEVRYWFEYQGNESLTFRGDDDVWVFVNKQLAVDLGGVHAAEDGSLVLDASNGTGVVCDAPDSNQTSCSNTYRHTVDFGLALGSVYEIVVFQAERHIVASNYRLTLGNFSARRSSCEPVCGDGVVTGNEQCDLGEENNTGEYGGCNSDCTLAPYCGDHHVDTSAGEICDDGVNATPYGSTSGCAQGCVPVPYCGDGVRDTDYGEVCDQGQDNSDQAYGLDQCTTACQAAPFCGDGFRNGSEQCDDGAANGTPSSGCDTSCHIKCGNGVKEAGEECDEGAANNTGEYGGCRSNCTLAPYCGDGFRNGSEQCDDGKNDGSYGTCMPDCTLAPYCGNGVKEASEECDNGSDNKSDGYGEDLCTTRCRPAPYCGDGAVDTSHGEVCDDGPDNSNSTPGACKVDCSGYNPPSAGCGNGVKDAGEQCDDGSRNGTASSSCDLRCQYKCGNGIKEDGEECDDGTNDGSYGTCMPDCTLPEYCGDGIKNGPEQCDLGEDNQENPYGKNTCTTQCLLGPYCGDGRVQPAHEECDGQVGCDANCTHIVIE